jgi:hypothetical protein
MATQRRPAGAMNLFTAGSIAAFGPARLTIEAIRCRICCASFLGTLTPCLVGASRAYLSASYDDMPDLMSNNEEPLHSAAFRCTDDPVRPCMTALVAIDAGQHEGVPDADDVKQCAAETCFAPGHAVNRRAKQSRRESFG